MSSTKLFLTLLASLCLLAPDSRAEDLPDLPPRIQPPPVPSEQPDWICDHTRRLTSTFCELRGRRYHAGIDLSTHGGVGLELKAPADVEVVRISAGFWGYGKQLMLQDEEGRQYLFAHLLDFRADLEDYLLEHQLRADRYRQTLYPPAGRFRIARGEVFARSGDTGSGPPHIHMEVRRGGSVAINPLLQGFGLPDSRPPELVELALFPAQHGVTIEGGHLPLVLKPEKDGWQVRSSGPVWLALRCQDRINGSSSRLAPWRIEILQQDSLLFRTTFEELPFAMNHQVCEEVNRWLQLRENKVFHNLIQPAGELPFVSHPDPAETHGPASLSLDPAQSPELILRVTDTVGNTSEALLRLLPEDPVKPTRQASAPSVKSLEIPWNLDELWLRDDTGVLGAAWMHHGLQLSVLKNGIEKSSPLALREGEGSLAFQLTESDSSLAFRAQAGESRSDSPLWHLRRLRAGQPDLYTLELEQGRALIGSERNSVVEDQWMLLREDSSGVEIGPLNLRLVQEATLALPVPDSLARAHTLGKAAIYHNDDGDWDWAGGESFGESLSAEIAWPGRYTILADTTAPRITPRGKWLPVASVSPVISFRCRDERSGVADVRMWIDGKRVMARYDPEGDRVLYRPRLNLRPGEHELRIEAEDRCGNRSDMSLGFRVE